MLERIAVDPGEVPNRARLPNLGLRARARSDPNLTIGSKRRAVARRVLTLVKLFQTPLAALFFDRAP
jgi:hypothetical protein